MLEGFDGSGCGFDCRVVAGHARGDKRSRCIAFGHAPARVGQQLVDPAFEQVVHRVDAPQRVGTLVVVQRDRGQLGVVVVHRVARLEREVEVAEVAQLFADLRFDLPRDLRREVEEHVAGFLDRFDHRQAHRGRGQPHQMREPMRQHAVARERRAPQEAHHLARRQVGVEAELREVFEKPRPVVIVLAGVVVEHALVRVVAVGVVAQHVTVEVAEAHDEVGHRRHEGQAIARRDRFVAQEIEEGQLRVAVLAAQDVDQDRLHGGVVWVDGAAEDVQGAIVAVEGPRQA